MAVPTCEWVGASLIQIYSVYTRVLVLSPSQLVYQTTQQEVHVRFRKWSQFFLGLSTYGVVYFFVCLSEVDSVGAIVCRTGNKSKRN